MGRSRSARARRRPLSVDTSVGHVEVVADPDRPGAGTLVIDGQVHGQVDPADPTRLALDYQARAVTIAAALLPADRPARVVHLGGGAFAIPRALAALRPDDHHLVLEKSAAVIRVAEQALGLRRGDRLAVRKGDARGGLRRLEDGLADLVVGDAFVDGETPRQLTTVEAMAEVRRVLAPDGHLVVNVVDAQPWGALGVQAAAAAEVFDDVAAAGSRGVARLVDPGNVFLLAGRDVPRRRLASAGAAARHPVALVADGPLRALVRQHRPRHDADG